MKLADAKARFSEVVQTAMLGETVIITKENRPVVRITAIKPAKRVPGTGKGVWMAPDFDAPAGRLRGVYVIGRPSGHTCASLVVRRFSGTFS